MKKKTDNQNGTTDVTEQMDGIIHEAIKDGVSDIHFEATGSGGRIRLRIDGILRVSGEFKADTFQAFVKRLKVMSALNVECAHLPQDGRIRLNVDKRPIDLRVATMPTIHGEGVVVRILNRETVILDLGRLCFSEERLATLKRWREGRWGAIFLTGPVGSGKTTTMYSLVNELNDDQTNVCSIEDPVEFALPGIAQTRVDVRSGLTISNALRAVMRTAPDVIMVGETRDVDTVKLIFNAALTGHLVFSQLHTETATEAVSRLVDMGLDPFIIKSALKGVVNQRLVRKLCDHCKEKTSGDEDVFKHFNLPKGGYFKAKGCEKCGDTGYRGRVPIYEFFELSIATTRLLMEKATTEEIRQQAVKEGMRTLWDAGMEKAKNGVTSIDELLRVLGSSKVKD